MDQGLNTGSSPIPSTGLGTPVPGPSDLIDQFLIRHPDLHGLVHRLFREDLVFSQLTTTAEIMRSAGVANQEESAGEVAHAPWTLAERQRVDSRTVELAVEHLSAERINAILLGALGTNAERLREYLASGRVNGRGLKEMLELVCSESDPELTFLPEHLEATRKDLALTLLTDDPELLDRAKKLLTIRDYLDIIGRVIGTEDGIGRIGGKATGELLASKALELKLAESPVQLPFPIAKPYSHYLTAQDCFEAFLKFNHLSDYRDHKYRPMDDIVRLHDETQSTFRNGRFPPEIEKKLMTYLEQVGEGPIMVRSSSLLEDSTKAPFNGKYATKIFLNQGTLEERLTQLIACIGEVYGSTYSPDALAYRKDLGLLDVEENMGVILQKMVGKQFGKLFMPVFSGVGFSFNDEIWDESLNSEDGGIRLVMGLGIAAVDEEGDNGSRVASLTRPSIRPDGTSFKRVLDSCQKYLWGVDLEQGKLVKVPLSEFLKEAGYFNGLYNYLSSADFESQLVRPGMGREGRSAPFITFDGLLAEEAFEEEMKWIMSALRDTFGFEVDMEFASDGGTLCLLQCRRQNTYQDAGPVELPEHIQQSDVVFQAEDRMVPTQRLEDMTHIVYVDPALYSHLVERNDYLKVVDTLRKINECLDKKSFILMGPGRWGTNWDDPALGVPVGFGALSNCAALVEILDTRVGRFEKCSFGSHFSGDLRRMNIRVLPIYPGREGNWLNDEILTNSPNLLKELVPQADDLPEGLIRVIDIRKGDSLRTLRFASDKRTGKAIAYINHPEETQASQ